jgi:hypothetical protein
MDLGLGSLGGYHSRHNLFDRFGNPKDITAPLGNLKPKPSPPKKSLLDSPNPFVISTEALDEFS